MENYFFLKDRADHFFDGGKQFRIITEWFNECGTAGGMDIYSILHQESCLNQ
jgi:hypothetical protein